MGKKIRVQRRGRGSSTFRARPRRGTAKVGYPLLPFEGPPTIAAVEELIHDLGRPLARLRLSDGTESYLPAAEGMYVGQRVSIGADSSIAIGNILPLSDIPDGTVIFNVERLPRDGGKFARSSGSYATVVGHLNGQTVIRFPSGKKARLSSRCLATVGVVAGGGRPERPFFKAGKKYHLMKAKGHMYPRTRGVAMVSAAHPFGGGSHQRPGKPTTVSRGTPPGRKVGLIAAKTSGRGRRRTRKS
ncbi:MAG: 50S ribosomal protein L2 [Candidatus Bathyarchaeia archaeon]